MQGIRSPRWECRIIHSNALSYVQGRDFVAECWPAANDSPAGLVYRDNRIAQRVDVTPEREKVLDYR